MGSVKTRGQEENAQKYIQSLMLSFCITGIVCKPVQVEKTCMSLDGLSFPMKQADFIVFFVGPTIIGTHMWTLYVYLFYVCEISLHRAGKEGGMRVSSG